jgi:hypothetical protein
MYLPVYIYFCQWAGIVTSYGLNNQGVGVWVQVGSRIFFLQVFQTGSGVHLTSYPMDTGGSYPGGKADHSPPASAEIKKMWIYTSTPPYALMEQCLIS